jgi:hypothetical protein
MSDMENPYQSPETPIVPETSQSTGASLTETMLRYLTEASPWLRFIGVLGYIFCGLILLMGILGTAGASAITAATLGAEAASSIPTWLFLLIYLPIAVLFFFPAHFTFNFGQKIRNYKFSNSTEDLETAFKNNKSLWKFYGIICIIYLAFIPVSILIMIIMGIMAAASVL